MRTASFLIGCGFFLLSNAAVAQKKDAPPPKKPDEKEMKLFDDSTNKLRETINALPKSVPDSVRIEVEIYLKAAEWVQRHREWVSNDSAKWLNTTLAQGMERAAEAAAGKASWQEPQGKFVARAYRSRLDDSLQPYAVAYPPDYGKDPSKKWRLDITLHGRDGTICETKFLATHSPKDTAKGNDFVQIDIYGRGNNAYRWAGEADVFEALENFIAVEKSHGRDLIDPKRIVLRGFSMGGAGTWHLGLHHPDRFCVIGPGAGFTNTHAYVKTLPDPLPPYQEPCLHIYDAVDYSENAFNVPIVAYSGEIDAQKAAADNIEERVKKLGITSMVHLIAPGLAHAFPAEWQKKAEAEYVKHAGAGQGRAKYPDHIRFVTYTLKFPRCDWVELLQLDKHYEEARVEATHKDRTLTLMTKNVHMLRLTPPEGDAPVSVVINGQKMNAFGNGIFVQDQGEWLAAKKPLNDGSRKTHGLQGPIDDAFTTGFLCVRGTGKAWHEATGKMADSQLERFTREWDHWMRGKLTVKKDTEVTAEDIATKNLILFGDPSSNSLIADVLPKLPLTWTKDTIKVGDTSFDPKFHLPMMIYPNPKNPNRYVVINSGHTFHDEEFKGTNALLFPRLGDYAVARKTPNSADPAVFEIAVGGIFDDEWKVRK